MHGLIVNQLQRFVVMRYGRDAWTAVARAAGLGEAMPGMDQTYPDSVALAAIAHSAAVTRIEPQQLLGEFGAFLAPTLLRVYQPLVREEWGALEVIEHTEEHIHTAVRLRDADAGPPYLRARRVAPDEVQVTYTSPRGLCAMAEGIARGIAEHFGERVEVAQPECMHRGDARCLITVRRLA